MLLRKWEREGWTHREARETVDGKREEEHRQGGKVDKREEEERIGVGRENIQSVMRPQPQIYDRQPPRAPLRFILFTSLFLLSLFLYASPPVSALSTPPPCPRCPAVGRGRPFPVSARPPIPSTSTFFPIHARSESR